MCLRLQRSRQVSLLHALGNADDLIRIVLLEGALVSRSGYRQVLAAAQRREVGNVDFNGGTRHGLLFLAILVPVGALGTTASVAAAGCGALLPPARCRRSSVVVARSGGLSSRAALLGGTRRSRRGGCAARNRGRSLTRTVTGLITRRSSRHRGSLHGHVHWTAIGIHQRHGHPHVTKRSHVHHRHTRSHNSRERSDGVRVHREERANHSFRFKARLHTDAAEGTLLQTQVQQCVLRVFFSIHGHEPSIANLTSDGSGGLGTRIVEDLSHLGRRGVTGDFTQDDGAPARGLDIGFNLVVQDGHDGGVHQGLAQQTLVLCEGLHLGELHDDIDRNTHLCVHL
mmetsp:Transcript_40572/g.70207  ORF Transcript_40572/g.70207 Transcript_40572/m.70207 type:complete len:341 (-) Transcript_40572:430-1452(-)